MNLLQVNQILDLFLIETNIKAVLLKCWPTSYKVVIIALATFEPLVCLRVTITFLTIIPSYRCKGKSSKNSLKNVVSVHYCQILINQLQYVYFVIGLWTAHTICY